MKIRKRSLSLDIPSKIPILNANVQGKPPISKQTKDVGRFGQHRNIKRETASVIPSTRVYIANVKVLSPNKSNLKPSKKISARSYSSPLKEKNAKTPKKHRPAWDLRGKVQDMEKEILEARNESNTLDKHMKELREQIMNQKTLEDKLKYKQTEVLKDYETIDLLEVAFRNKELEFQELESSRQKLVLRNESQQGEILSVSKVNAELKDIVSTLSHQNSSLQAKIDTVKNLNQEILERNAYIKSIISNMEETSREIETKLCEEERLRKLLHNTMQELKGNVRVFCRVRPSLISSNINCSLHFYETNTIILTPVENSSGRGRNSSHRFKFDSVFKPSATQRQVFEEVSQLVQSVLDGFNVCIFAYGQTGSGKTYTMEGLDTSEFSLNTPELGIIPRSIEQIFDACKEFENKGWQYEMEASYLEIYNETIRDLLGKSGSSGRIKHDIKMVGPKEVAVSNLTQVSIKSKVQVTKLMRLAHKNRAVATTRANEHSSRSHSVFCLRLSGNNDVTGEACESTLNLIDLAGSERITDSGTQEDRLRELKNINKSLSNIGNVIMALAQKSEHIPYRNSKLTHLLMNSLGGNSKILMFVTVSPQKEHYNETLNSLRFASMVNQCQVGTATKRVI